MKLRVLLLLNIFKFGNSFSCCPGISPCTIEACIACTTENEDAYQYMT